MSCQSLEKCPFCEDELISSHTTEDCLCEYIYCPNCGKVKFKVFPDDITNKYKNEIAAFLYYKKVEKRLKGLEYSGIVFKEAKDELPDEKIGQNIVINIDEAIAFYPKTFSETIDRILLGIADRSKYIGDVVEMSPKEKLNAFFVKKFDKNGNTISSIEISKQFCAISDYLTNNNYINISRSDKTAYMVELLPEGWKRVDELQVNVNSESKNVFVAMSFAEDMAEVREAIKKAITDNDYSPRIMDEIEHNHQIVPEMLHEIRQSKFIVAELTGHNNGAYFEAGYALGNGKEVIQVCRKDRFGTDGHFDVKQINTILWETTEELTQKLSARIKETIK